MNINTDQLVDILKNDQPLNVTAVEENGRTKLVCLFALPELEEEITKFAQSILDRK